MKNININAAKEKIAVASARAEIASRLRRMERGER